jgi:hypothetical protein
VDAPVATGAFRFVERRVGLLDEQGDLVWMLVEGDPGTQLDGRK